MKMEFGVEFKRFVGKKKVGSTYYELSEEEYDKLKDIANHKIQIKGV